MQKINFLISNNFFALEQFGPCAINSIINTGRLVLNCPRIWLHIYGIQSTGREWFKWYLHNGNKELQIKTPDSKYITHSKWGITNHGVSQVQHLFLSILSNICVSMIFPNK